MGDPAPLKLITRNTKHHVVLDPSGGMTKDATELHYDCLSAQTRDGAYPLHIAIQANAPHTVLELLIKEAPEVLRFPNKFGETPLHLSLKKGPKAPEEEIELLLKSEPLVLYVHDAQGNLPIHIAASHGCTVNVTKRLVDLWPESTSEVNKAGSNAMACGRNAECDEEVLGLLAITDRIPHGFE
jgi:ankyrin repeat protein